jgi:tetratricopeptide (TPR) repeat protein
MKGLFLRAPMILALFLFLLSCAALRPVQQEAPREAPRPEAERKEPGIEKEPIQEPEKPIAEPAPAGIPPDPFESFPEKYRFQAREFEKRNDPRNALFRWEIVNSFQPDDPESLWRMRELANEIRVKSGNHFRQGLQHLQKKNIPAARREFLMALAYEPDNGQILDYAKPKFGEEDSFLYVTKEGDTTKSVAQHVYGDANKDFLILYFNDLKVGGPIKSETPLKLPKIQMALNAKRGTSLEEMVNQAKASLRSRNYEDAVSYAERALEYAPNHRGAKDLKNAAYYQWGTLLLQKKEYWNSLRMFKKVDENYKNVTDLVVQLEKRLQEQKGTAEDHYLKGVKHFIAQELDEAVHEWEATLYLDPQHPRAKKDLERVRRLKENLPKDP